MPQFSEASKEELDTCHDALRKTCRRVILYYDFSVLEGHRGKQRQNRLVREGRSQVKWPNSDHNGLPSRAVDLAPYPIDWGAEGRFYILAGHMKQAFMELQDEGEIDDWLLLQWGGDWDGDGVLDDQAFDDLPHFAVIEA